MPLGQKPVFFLIFFIGGSAMRIGRTNIDNKSAIIGALVFLGAVTLPKISGVVSPFVDKIRTMVGGSK